MRFLLHLAAAAFAVALCAACSDNDQFRVNGTIEGKPTMNLRATYYADGACHSVITAVRDGEFEFYASSSHPTLMEISDYDYKPLGYLFVQNGSNFEISIDPADPYAVDMEGSDVNSRWGAFLHDKAAELKSDPNAAVEAYVRANPADILSTILMLTQYDASQLPADADSLMATISPEAQPSYLTEGYNFLLQRLVSAQASAPVGTLRYYGGADTLLTFYPEGARMALIAFSGPGEGRADSIVPALRRLSRSYGRKALRVMDYSFDPDTLAWRVAVKPDSATWTQGWLPGALASPGIERLGVPYTPFFIVCDSAGTQLYRGSSLARVEALADSILRQR